MHAVVEIAGMQFKVAQNDTIVVPSLDAEVGKTVKFDRVLLTTDEKATKVGNPLVAGVNVEATILGHGREDKVIVFKKKKRKGYRVRRGHRQGYTQVQITKIA